MSPLKGVYQDISPCLYIIGLLFILFFLYYFVTVVTYGEDWVLFLNNQTAVIGCRVMAT